MSEDSLRNKLKLLQAQREALEIEADAISSELRSPGPNGEPPAGIKDSLVDSEGFPRADIDIFNVKQKRHRLSVINYDYSAIMKEIESLLPQVLARDEANENDDASQQGKPSSTSSSSSSSSPTSSSPLSIFRALPCMAYIDEILDGSPAKAAGLRDRDELLAFGSVRCDLPEGHSAAMAMIPNVVRNSINSPISLVVRREGEILGELLEMLWFSRYLGACICALVKKYKQYLYQL